MTNPDANAGTADRPCQQISSGHQITTGTARAIARAYDVFATAGRTYSPTPRL
jgi:hypothetical protein